MRSLYKKITVLGVSFTFIFSLFFPGSDTVITKVKASPVVQEKILVGGMPFGVKFYSEGIIIVGFSEIETESGTKTPAYDAGLRVNDVITHVNGKEVATSAELVKMIENAKEEIEITYVRDGNESTVKFVPEVSPGDGKRKTGMWVRDTTAGIGTVTFMIPETGAFAGLGHGICSSDSGELLKMERGTVVNVRISGVSKGVAGTPGELKGFFTTDKSGVLLGNTACGVYGILSDIPYDKVKEENVEIADREEVHTGDAYIWCTVESDTPKKYSIEITEINKKRNDNRSFSIKVTDKSLLEKTGGIVQGMSGSPIIQDGKLIGAVTHVLVNDPSEGYGIFIENMFDMMPGIIS